MKYKVLVKGMFVDGTLYRQGETFEATEDNAAILRNRSPHLKFGGPDEQNKRVDDFRRGHGQDPDKTDARLQSSDGESQGPKKRGSRRGKR
jgi:hypothetical protein